MSKQETPIVISYSETYTVNLGNYESTKVMFGISYPLYDQKKFKKIKRQIVKVVHDEISRRIAELKEEYGAGEVTLEEISGE